MAAPPSKKALTAATGVGRHRVLKHKTLPLKARLKVQGDAQIDGALGVEVDLKPSKSRTVSFSSFSTAQEHNSVPETSALNPQTSQRPPHLFLGEELGPLLGCWGECDQIRLCVCFGEFHGSILTTKNARAKPSVQLPSDDQFVAQLRGLHHLFRCEAGQRQQVLHFGNGVGSPFLCVHQHHQPNSTAPSG